MDTKKTSLIFWQLIKFAIVGVIGVSINYSIFFVLYHFFSVYYIVSSALGFIIGIFFVFFLNKLFTFSIKDNSRTKVMIVKYYILNLSLAGLGMIILYCFVDLLKLNPYISNGVMLLIISLFHFIGSRLLIFNQKPDNFNHNNIY